MKNFLQAVQRNQLLTSPGPTGRGGVIKNFIKRGTPTRPDLKVRQSPTSPGRAGGGHRVWGSGRRDCLLRKTETYSQFWLLPWISAGPCSKMASQFYFSLPREGKLVGVALCGLSTHVTGQGSLAPILKPSSCAEKPQLLYLKSAETFFYPETVEP